MFLISEDSLQACTRSYCTRVYCYPNSTLIGYVEAVTYNPTTVIIQNKICDATYIGPAYSLCYTFQCGTLSANDGHVTVFGAIGTGEVAVETKDMIEAQKVGKFITANRDSLGAEAMLLAIKSNYGLDGYHPHRNEDGTLTGHDGRD